MQHPPERHIHCKCPPSPGRRCPPAASGRVFSPQMPPVDSAGQDWAGTCNEYGVPAGAAFTLCLFVVSEEGLQEVARWHAQGKATGRYPPFATVPGGALLAKIPLRVAKRG